MKHLKVEMFRLFKLQFLINSNRMKLKVDGKCFYLNKIEKGYILTETFQHSKCFI